MGFDLGPGLREQTGGAGPSGGAHGKRIDSGLVSVCRTSVIGKQFAETLCGVCSSGFCDPSEGNGCHAQTPGPEPRIRSTSACSCLWHCNSLQLASVFGTAPIYRFSGGDVGH